MTVEAPLGTTVLAWPIVDMDAASPKDPAAGRARRLLALRHALADPLSAATLKLDLIGRRLSAPAGAEPAWIAERVRGAQGDVNEANARIDLLLRLAEIDGESPEPSSLEDVCRNAGVSLTASPAAQTRLTLRKRAATDAIRTVASFARRGEAAAPGNARAALEGGSVTLSLEGASVAPGLRPEMLLELPRGLPEADALFEAWAAVEADDGRLELLASSGRFLARFTWPAGRTRSAR